MTFSWADCLTALVRGENLDEQIAAEAMRSIMSGEATPGQIGGFLLALRAKGETVEEITGLARVMREFSLRVPVEGDLLDTCGTGGDRAGTCNISTMAAVVAAGAGARVAKHGNRAASSSCGSADVLEAMGVAIELDPDGVAACIDEAGIGFCFAPAFHPAMRHAGPVRRELGVPTVFNFLGPLTNPAGAQRQTVGVSDAAMAPMLAEALYRLGAQRALVFRGDDGLDELSTGTTSSLWSVDGGVTPSSLDPSEFGIERAMPGALAGGTAEDNARIFADLLDGKGGPVRDAVLLNAGAALHVGGLAGSIADGIGLAAQAIDSRAAADVMARFRETSQRVRSA